MREEKFDRIIHGILHVLEAAIAIITILMLLASLGLEVYRLLTVKDYFHDLEEFLHNILTIVVGLEFVRMLIDLTPGNILEVLTVAIARHVILSHEDPLSNVACIVCIAGLFAVRRFLIPRKELRREMSETE